nr:MAG TPA: hypothetical protein [Caudoviricetes sp.]
MKVDFPPLSPLFSFPAYLLKTAPSGATWSIQ